jgi:transposase
LAAYEQGGKTQPEIAAIYGVTLRTFQRWLRAWRQENRYAPLPRPGRPHVFAGAAAEQLRRLIKEQPDATLHELAERAGGSACHTTVHRTLERWNLPLKKRRSEPPNKTDPT